MGYRVRHCITDRFVWVEFLGTVTSADVVGAVEAAFAPEHWVEGSDILWDGRGIERLLLDVEALEDIAGAKAAQAAARASSRSAVVASRDLDVEMAMMLSRYGESEPRRVGVFRGEAKALAFLERTAIPEGCPVTAERADEAP
jgi:hypothetical protein